MKMALRKLSLEELKNPLICIVLLLLFLQLASAKPIHLNMENSANNVQDFHQITPEEKKCLLLQNVCSIAVSGYNSILNEINNYTRKTYRLDHLEHHKEWIHHHNEALDPKQGRLKFDNYHVSPPDSVFKHLYPTDINIEEKAEHELLNIYVRFKIILNAIQQIIKAKEADGNFNVEHDPSVMSFYKKQEIIIIELLQEIEIALQTLSIDIPEINNNIIDYKNDGFDWITIREYLKLLLYTTKVFNILLENCQNLKSLN